MVPKAVPDLPFELLDGLPAAAVRAFLGSAQPRELSAGMTLCEEGAPAVALFVLTAGFAKLVQTGTSGARVILGYLRPGEAFGASGCWEDGIYPADAVAVTRGFGLQWPAERIRELFLAHPRAAQNAIAALEARLRETERRLREMYDDGVEQRMAKALARLVERVGTATPDGIEVPFPFSREDFANLSGTTLHTVSRTLSAWEARGMVRRGRRHLAVLRLPALVSLAHPTVGSEARAQPTQPAPNVSPALIGTEG